MAKVSYNIPLSLQSQYSEQERGARHHAHNFGSACGERSRAMTDESKYPNVWKSAHMVLPPRRSWNAGQLQLTNMQAETSSGAWTEGPCYRPGVNFKEPRKELDGHPGRISTCDPERALESGRHEDSSSLSRAGACHQASAGIPRTPHSPRLSC